jgi:hypothetical protein
VIVSLWPAVGGCYHPDGYRAAFAMLFVLQLPAFAWLMLGVRQPKVAVPEPGRVG